jgi:hypothetical protein
MNYTISIKKVTRNNHDYPAIKFNPDQDISMSFIQEAVFALIVTAIRPLTEEQKELFVSGIRENMLKLDLVKLSAMQQ